LSQGPAGPTPGITTVRRALKKAGKTFAYFTYPGEGHGFTQRDHRLDVWRKQLDFLQKYLGKPGDPVSSSGAPEPGGYL
jgi:dienelactone hydrolase